MTRGSPREDTGIISSEEISGFYGDRSWSQLPRGLRTGSTATLLLRLWVRIPPEPLMSVCCECCVLSGRGLCDELITRPDESYRLWFLWARSGQLKNEEALTHVRPQRHREKIWRREIHCRVHKSSPLDHIQNQMNKSRLWHPVSLMFILILSSHVSLAVNFPTARLCCTLTHVAYVCRLYTMLTIVVPSLCMLAVVTNRSRIGYQWTVCERILHSV